MDSMFGFNPVLCRGGYSVPFIGSVAWGASVGFLSGPPDAAGAIMDVDASCFPVIFLPPWKPEVPGERGTAALVYGPEHGADHTTSLAVPHETVTGPRSGT